MSILRYLLIILFFIDFGFSNNPIFAAEKLETVTLQLHWFHQFQFTGYYAAKEKGFYADEGLDVIFKESDTDKGYIPTVLDGKAEYGTANAGLLQDRAKGKPVVVLKQIFQHSPLVFISLKKSGIVSPHDMIGKKVMFNPEEDAPLLAMLLDTLGSLNKIKTVPYSFNYEDLVTGKVDVISAFISDQPFIFKQRGIPVNIINPQNFGIDFYGDNLFTTEKEINTHPERVERMIRASLKGWQYALRHPEEIIDLIISKYNPKLTREQLIYEAKMTNLMILPEITPLGLVTPQRYVQIAEIYEKAGLAKLSVNPCLFTYKCTDYTKKKHGLSLTPQEQAWLIANPTIRFTGDPDWLPQEAFTSEGQYIGIVADILDLLEARLGILFERVPVKTWTKALRLAEAAEVDVLSETTSSENNTYPGGGSNTGTR